MRTTVNIDDGILRDAKRLAGYRRVPLGHVVDEALAMLLAHERRNPKPSGRVELPVSGGGGLQPGVDLDDKEALMDLLDLPDLPEPPDMPDTPDTPDTESDARAAG